VGPRWVKGERGKWNPVELHVAFIRGLKAGQEITLEIQHAERDHFAILELSAEQRKSAGGAGRHEPRERAKRSDRPRNQEARIKELEAEVRRLKAENAELRRKLERAKGKRR